MSPDAGDRLAEYALAEVGDEVRTVAILYEDGCEVIYIREDLRESYSPAEYKRLAGSFRIDMREDQHDEEDAPIGPKRSLIHYHGDAYVFQFPHEECHSVLLSVAPSVGSRLRSFISDCEERI
jgi:hypothetical protein